MSHVSILWRGGSSLADTVLCAHKYMFYVDGFQPVGLADYAGLESLGINHLEGDALVCFQSVQYRLGLRLDPSA